MCTVHDVEPKLARLSRLRKSQIPHTLIEMCDCDCVFDLDLVAVAGYFGQSIGRFAHLSILGSDEQIFGRIQQVRRLRADLLTGRAYF
jgi:hypothetical protein